MLIRRATFIEEVKRATEDNTELRSNACQTVKDWRGCARDVVPIYTTIRRLNNYEREETGVNQNSR